MIDTSYAPAADAAAPTAFCQNCGKPLTAATTRNVGPAVYCEPCLAARLAGAPAAGAGAGAGYPGAAAPVWPAGTPNPGMATLLGFIPGVGAMYNEQYAKGIVHLAVFAVLIVLADNVNGIFGLFIAGWEFYMAIEAHHTARARRDHLPLPNPFGLNDVGERMGFGKAWPTGAPSVASVFHDAAQAAAAAAQNIHANQGGHTTSWQPGARPEAPAPGAGAPPPAWESQWQASAAAAPPPVNTFGDWSHAGTTEQANKTHEYAQNSAAGTQEAWRDTFGSVPPPATAPFGAQDAAYVAATPSSRFPAGAVWLIGAGVFFLVATTGIFSFLRGELLVGLGLVALAVWIFVGCMLRSGSTLASDGSPAYTLRALRASRGSAWVGLTGLLFVLDALHVLGWGRSWPLYIILAGVLGFLERGAHHQAGTYPAGPRPGL